MFPKLLLRRGLLEHLIACLCKSNLWALRGILFRLWHLLLEILLLMMCIVYELLDVAKVCGRYWLVMLARCFHWFLSQAWRSTTTIGIVLIRLGWRVLLLNEKAKELLIIYLLLVRMNSLDSIVCLLLSLRGTHRSVSSSWCCEYLISWACWNVCLIVGWYYLSLLGWRSVCRKFLLLLLLRLLFDHINFFIAAGRLVCEAVVNYKCRFVNIKVVSWRHLRTQDCTSGGNSSCSSELCWAYWWLIWAAARMSCVWHLMVAATRVGGSLLPRYGSLL
jgi:hypothetical protein